MKPVKVNALVVVSDTHSGCQLALCPPEVKLDSGGTYKSSKLQTKLRSYWEELWGEIVPSWCRGKPFALVHNGDPIDGAKHQASSRITDNLKDQKLIFQEVMKLPLGNPLLWQDDNQLGYYQIRGTAAHGGEADQNTEEAAQTLGAIPTEEGIHARWELWKYLGDEQERLVHLTHHIGVTSSAQHEVSAVNAEISYSLSEAGRWKERPPDVVVRSHRHRCSVVDLPNNRGGVFGAVTPAWQAKPPYVFKSMARNSVPQFGAIYVCWGDEELYIRKKVWNIGRPRPE